MFASGFDLQNACAVAGSDDPDDFAILDRLDALVRKSLLVAERSSGRTRFSMLETIRHSPRSNSCERGGERGPSAHARYFAEREADILALWDSPRQREVYDWFTAELANLRQRFGGPATMAISTWPPPSPPNAAIPRRRAGNYEPVAWAEEMIETARAVDHPRLAFLYAMATQCWFVDESRRRSGTPRPDRR